MNVWKCDISAFCQIIKLLSMPCKSIWALVPQSPLFTMNQLQHPSWLDKEHVSVWPPEDPKSNRMEAFCPQRCNDCWSALSTQSSLWWMLSSVRSSAAGNQALLAINSSWWLVTNFRNLWTQPLFGVFEGDAPVGCWTFERSLKDLDFVSAGSLGLRSV